MKCLVIGIDGADHRILEKFSLKFLTTFIEKNHSIDLKEDMWSRGWAEILSGLHGNNSGAFYAKPRLDGSHLSTSEFSSSNYRELTSPPLWEELNVAGYSTGFMNVPTMYPAPKVNGFVVAGAGAGASTDGVGLVPDDACYPEKLSVFLNNKDYILDVRLSRMSTEDHKTYINKLIQMQNIQTESFIELLKKEKVDFGFIAFTSVVRAQMTYMRHFEDISSEVKYDPESIEFYLQSLYINLDDCIEKLVEFCAAENVVLVSDHGQSAQRYTSNINMWLIENGFAKTKVKKINKPINFIKKFTPSFLKKYISKHSTSLKDYLSPVNLDWADTSAFSLRYIPGIYMNDNSRFLGSKTDQELSEISENIIDKFNESDLNKKFGMVAEIYRSTKTDAKHERLLPDIWIHHPEDVFPAASGEKSIQENPNYRYIDDLASVTHDMFAGSKGIKPFVVCSNSLKEHCKDLDEYDLTAVHSLILRAFGLIK